MSADTSVARLSEIQKSLLQHFLVLGQHPFFPGQQLPTKEKEARNILQVSHFCLCTFCLSIRCGNKIQSLYSEHLLPTPILKSVQSQFSHFLAKCLITNEWYPLQNNSCPKTEKQMGNNSYPKREKQIESYRNWNTNTFQFPPCVHVKCESMARGTKVRFNLFRVQRTNFNLVRSGTITTVRKAAFHS